jgi:hypothetical protein
MLYFLDVCGILFFTLLFKFASNISYGISQILEFYRWKCQQNLTSPWQLGDCWRFTARFLGFCKSLIGSMGQSSGIHGFRWILPWFPLYFPSQTSPFESVAGTPNNLRNGVVFLILGTALRRDISGHATIQQMIMVSHETFLYFFGIDKSPTQI